MATTDSLQQQAYDQIKHGLLMGAFPPGRRLSRRKLAEATGVSAPSVQHVLGQLANEGLVEIRPQSGTYPKILSTEEFDDVSELRRLLEPHAAEQAAQLATKKQIATLLSAAKEMIQLAEKMAASDDPVGDYLESWYMQERRLHSTIWQAARNQLIKTTLENSHILAMAALRAHERADGFCVSSAGAAKEHVAIAQAIADRDSAAARATMLHHLRANPWQQDVATDD